MLNSVFRHLGSVQCNVNGNNALQAGLLIEKEAKKSEAEKDEAAEKKESSKKEEKNVDKKDGSKKGSIKDGGSKKGKGKPLDALVVDVTALRVLVDDAKKAVKIDVQELNFAKGGGLQKIKITNGTDERQAIKIECSDNAVYRTNPVCTFAEPNADIEIEVQRQAGVSKADKIDVVHIPVSHVVE